MTSRKATTALSSASAAKKQRQENSSNDDENASSSLLNRLLNSRRQQLKEQEEEEQHSIDMDTQEEPEEHRQLKMHFTLLLGLADGDYEKLLLMEKAMLQVRRQFTAVDVSRKQQQQALAQQKKASKAKSQRSKTKAALNNTKPWPNAVLKLTEQENSVCISPGIGFSQANGSGESLLICFHRDEVARNKIMIRTIDKTQKVSEPELLLDAGGDPVTRQALISDNSKMSATCCRSIWRLPDGSLKATPSPILVYDFSSLNSQERKLEAPKELVLDFPYDFVQDVEFQPSGKHMLVISGVGGSADDRESISIWNIQETNPKRVAKWTWKDEQNMRFEEDYIVWYSYQTSSIHAMAFDGTSSVELKQSVRLGLNRRRVLGFQPNPIDPSIIALYAHDMVTEDYHIKLVQLMFNDDKTAMTEIKFFDTKPYKGDRFRWHPDGRHLVYADGGKLNSFKVNIENPSPKLEKIRFTKHNQAGNLIKKVNSTLEDKKSKISKFSFSPDGSAVVTVQDVIVGDYYHHETIQVTSL